MQNKETFYISREEIVDIIGFFSVYVKEAMCLGEFRCFRFLSVIQIRSCYVLFKLDPVMD